MPTPLPSAARASSPGRPHFGGARALAALALSTAAGVHGTQAARHLADASFHGRLHAAFFVAAGLFQILCAVALIARRRDLRTTVVVAGNLALATVWVLAVTVGLPTRLVPTSPEPLTFAGGLAAGLASGAACVLVRARRRPAGEPTAGGPRRVRLSVPTAVASLALVAVGSAVPVSAQSHRHAAGAHHAAAAHDGLHVDGVHLHGLGGDEPDPGPDPARQARGRLSGTRVAIGDRPAAIAFDGGVVWVADRDAGLVSRLDAVTGRRLGEPTRVGVHPGGIATGEGSAWVTNAGSDTVSRLDRDTGALIATIPVGAVPVGVAAGGGAVWVANSAEGTVSRIEPSTGAVTTTARIGYGPTAVTFAAGRPWVVNSLDRAVVSLDPDAGTVRTETPVGAGASSVAFGHGSIWVASSSAGTVSRIDPSTGAAVGAPVVVDRRTQPGQGPAAVAVGARVWVLNNHDKTVVAIDPSTGSVSEPRFVDRRVAGQITPASLAATDAGELWATDAESGAVVRLQPRKDIR